jgi:TRAP-type mannitol/chloroaromatic compound transport system permease small subunit
VQGLLAVSRLVDRVNAGVGRTVSWLILASVLVSSINATIRYIFDMSSNAWLELQWYLFAAVFLLGSGYTLLRNEHVRIDILVSRLSPRGRALVDILGGLFFLLPMALLIMYLSWSGFIQSFRLHEFSADAGGLLRWPARLLIPVGFLLLSAQGISEIIKRIAFLAGAAPDPTEKTVDPHAEHAAN